MKKILSFFVIMSFFSCVFAVQIKDVPPDHWAYKSIKKLIQKGYLALYDDKTFRGDQPTSRTIFASVIGKLIDDIESGQIKPETVDLKEIKKLSAEFRNEISDYQIKLASLEKRIAELESGKVVIQKDLSKITYEFREADNKLKDKDEKLEIKISENQKEIEELKTKNTLLQEQIKKNEKKRKKRENFLWLGIIASYFANKK